MSISLPFQKRFKSIISYGEHNRTDLIKLIPISNATLSNALLYGIVPSTKVLIRIANFYNVSLNYLLGKSDSNDFIESAKSADFKLRFEELCKEKDVTHYKVANDCAFDKSNISKWFSKGYLPELEIIELLCDYFNVSIDYLLCRTDYKN